MSVPSPLLSLLLLLLYHFITSTTVSFTNIFYLYCIVTTTMTSLTYIINLAIINLLGVVHHFISAWPSLLRLLILFFVAAVASRRFGRRLADVRLISVTVQPDSVFGIPYLI